MRSKAYYILPDISGFTSFVKKNEIEHSKHIISELFETILTIAPESFNFVESEGDALYFYTATDKIDLNDILKFCDSSFNKFHNHLQSYEHKRICPCGACKTANQLTIKFIIHLGNLDFIEVNKQQKPYGQDSILAHRLLKNSIPKKSYILVSGVQTIENQPEWNHIKENYDGEEVKINYKTLEYFEPKDLEIKEKNHNLSKNYWEYKDIIDIDVDDLYEVISNLKYRKHWNTDPEDIEFDTKHINQEGIVHTCVINNKRIKFETIKMHIDQEDYVYAEKTNSIPILREMISLMLIKKIDNKSELTIRIIPDYYPFTKIFFSKILNRKFSSGYELLFDRIRKEFARN